MINDKQIDAQNYSTYKKIRFLLSSQPENRRILNSARLIVLFISNILIIPFSMFSGGFSSIYFYLKALKIIIFFALLFSFVYLAIGHVDSVQLWQENTTRKKEIFGRILHVLKESAIMLIVSSVIFGFFHVTGFPKQLEADFLQEHPSLAFPLHYTPATIELVLIITIIVFLLLTIPNIVYWYYSRCAQYTGYIEKKKLLKFDWKKILIGLSINFIVWSLALNIFLDQWFIATKFPGILASWAKFETIFASNAYILLVIEFALIVVLNLFYIIDGFLASKYRTNFIDLDSLATIE